MPRVHPKHKGGSGGRGGKNSNAADDHEAARAAKEKVCRLTQPHLCHGSVGVSCAHFTRHSRPQPPRLCGACRQLSLLLIREQAHHQQARHSLHFKRTATSTSTRPVPYVNEWSLASTVALSETWAQSNPPAPGVHTATASSHVHNLTRWLLLHVRLPRCRRKSAFVSRSRPRNELLARKRRQG
jgi:hypothetical protein